MKRKKHIALKGIEISGNGSCLFNSVGMILVIKFLFDPVFQQQFKKNDNPCIEKLTAKIAEHLREPPAKDATPSDIFEKLIEKNDFEDLQRLLDPALRHVLYFHVYQNAVRSLEDEHLSNNPIADYLIKRLYGADGSGEYYLFQNAITEKEPIDFDTVTYRYVKQLALLKNGDKKFKFQDGSSVVITANHEVRAPEKEPNTYADLFFKLYEATEQIKKEQPNVQHSHLQVLKRIQASAPQVLWEPFFKRNTTTQAWADTVDGYYLATALGLTCFFAPGQLFGPKLQKLQEDIKTVNQSAKHLYFPGPKELYCEIHGSANHFEIHVSSSLLKKIKEEFNVYENWLYTKQRIYMEENIVCGPLENDYVKKRFFEPAFHSAYTNQDFKHAWEINNAQRKKRKIRFPLHEVRLEVRLLQLLGAFVVGVLTAGLFPLAMYIRTIVKARRFAKVQTESVTLDYHLRVVADDSPKRADVLKKSDSLIDDDERPGFFSAYQHTYEDCLYHRNTDEMLYYDAREYYLHRLKNG